MIYEYWQVYKERVDPVTKILHIQSFEEKLHKAILDLQNISIGMEALLFSIYYAAVNSMTSFHFQKCACETKDCILQKYGYASKQALSNANILNSQDMLILQALTIYLVKRLSLELFSY